MPYKDPAKRKEKHREYSANHYQRNKQAVKAATNKRNKEKRAEFAAFKATLRCIQCGESHPATLDFHHHTPKPTNKKINHLISSKAFSKAYKEIRENCIVLCANCHRKHHYEEQKSQNGTLTE